MSSMSDILRISEFSDEEDAVVEVVHTRVHGCIVLSQLYIIILKFLGDLHSATWIEVMANVKKIYISRLCKIYNCFQYLFYSVWTFFHLFFECPKIYVYHQMKYFLVQRVELIWDVMHYFWTFSIIIGNWFIILL